MLDENVRKNVPVHTDCLQMNLLFIDQPGLLGPKSMLAFIMLSHARDEIHWLLRHADNLPQVKGKAKPNPEDLNDRHLPELLFYIEELRGMRKYDLVSSLSKRFCSEV